MHIGSPSQTPAEPLLHLLHDEGASLLRRASVKRRSRVVLQRQLRHLSDVRAQQQLCQQNETEVDSRRYATPRYPIAVAASGVAQAERDLGVRGGLSTSEREQLSGVPRILWRVRLRLHRIPRRQCNVRQTDHWKGSSGLQIH